MVIYKYPVPLDKAFFDLELPYNTKILAFQLQGVPGTNAAQPVIWALIDKNNVLDMRHFAIRGTGTPMNDWRSSDIYIGTVQIPPFVWHLFETKEEK